MLIHLDLVSSLMLDDVFPTVFDIFLKSFIENFHIYTISKPTLDSCKSMILYVWDVRLHMCERCVYSYFHIVSLHIVSLLFHYHE